MRLTCDVDVANLLLPTQSIKSGNKAKRSQISVGRKNSDSPAQLMICSNKDREGLRFLLQGNVEKIFAKFLHEGKATIRLTEPQYDVILSKADPVQLKSFLSVVKLGNEGKVEKITLSGLAPMTGSKQIAALRTKMSISSRKDYPVRDGFPARLETLQIRNCLLRKVDSRILRLRNLYALDLSDNNIQTLPDSWAPLQLTVLILSSNQLTEVPDSITLSPLTSTLKELDISNNKIASLKPNILNLKVLTDLKCSDNPLACLPQHFGTLRSLRVFQCARTQLRVLPMTFTDLHLDNIDIYGNPFMNAGVESARDRLQHPMTLLEICARTITKNNIRYTAEDLLPNLLEMLRVRRDCLCGGFSFRSFVHFLRTVDLHKVAASLTSVNDEGVVHVPVEAFLCSRECYQLLQQNPNATILRRRK